MSIHTYRTAPSSAQINLRLSSTGYSGCENTLTRRPIETATFCCAAILMSHPNRRMFGTSAAWEGKLHFTKTERAAIHYVKQWGFVDVFRKMNGDVKEFSWWDYRQGAWQRNQGLRIDHIWTSAPLADKCTGCWIDRSPRSLEKPSDHTPVVAEFDI